MAMDNERNRVLAALREQLEGADSSVLCERLSLPKSIVERHLLYCADYDLAKWRRARNGSGQAVITDRGRDYLARQSL
jgi:hypothetical protein